MKQKLLVLLAFLNYSAASWQYGTCSSGSQRLSTSQQNQNTDAKCFVSCRSYIVGQSNPWASTWCCVKDQYANKCYLYEDEAFTPNSGQTNWKGMAITETDTTFSETTSIDCSTVISQVSSAFTSTLYYGSTSPQTIYPSSSSTDWNTIFGNTDSTNCPITEC